MKRFSWMQLVRDFCDGFFEKLGEILLAFIRRVAPFAVPLAPASFSGHAIFAAVALMTSFSNHFLIPVTIHLFEKANCDNITL